MLSEIIFIHVQKIKNVGKRGENTVIKNEG